MIQMHEQLLHLSVYTPIINKDNATLRHANIFSIKSLILTFGFRSFIHS